MRAELQRVRELHEDQMARSYRLVSYLDCYQIRLDYMAHHMPVSTEQMTWLRLGARLIRSEADQIMATGGQINGLYCQMAQHRVRQGVAA